MADGIEPEPDFPAPDQPSPIPLPHDPDQTIRRKSTFVRRLDSSESAPSSRESIFAAECFSPPGSEDGGYKGEPWQDANSTPLSSSQHDGLVESQRQKLSASVPDNDENAGPSPIGNTPIIYGHGTPLATIVEQKSSVGSMRTSPGTTPRRSLISSGASSSAESAPVSSQFPASSPSKSHFSTSGLATPSESPCARDSPIDQIYAGPLSPVQPPVQRPSTPPGMPSWTAAQQRQPRNASRRASHGWGIHGASALLHRFVGRERPNGTSTGTRRGYWHGVPFHQRSFRSSNSRRSAPRFRSPRSGHGVANLESHPFARAEAMLPQSGAVDEASTSQPAPARSCSSASARSPEGHGVQRRRPRATGRRKPGQRAHLSTEAPSACTDATASDGTRPSGRMRRHGAPSSMALMQDGLSTRTTEHSPGSGPERGKKPRWKRKIERLVAKARALDGASASTAEPCWEPKLRRLVVRARGMWAGARWRCCWYCCGFDVEELREEPGAGPRMRNAMGRD